ncbi:hypothetical protein AX16_010061 [Volvariella volvacea WC 439]|nr:hypothetical protein AX16_010061 [Volvariella volvacea WC 439]
MVFAFLNILCCGCFSREEDESPAQHEVLYDETTRLMPHELEPIPDDDEPQDEETLRRQQMLGEIVRETEGKMVNMGIRFPFNLFPKNQQKTLSRSSSMYFDHLRTKGYDFYDGIHRDVYQDPYLGPRLHSDGFYYDSTGYRDPRDYDPNVVTYGPDGYREEPTYTNNTMYGGRPPSPTFGEFENYTYRRYKPNPDSDAGALWKLRVVEDNEVTQESELREASTDEHHFARKTPDQDKKPDPVGEAINRLKNFDPEVAIFKW